LVRKENGEYEYNPAKYQYEQDLEKQKTEAKKKGQTFTEIPFEESKYANKEVNTDPYSQRIDTILKVDTQNE